MVERITSAYIRDLACIYHRIDNRGILFDESVMNRLSYDIQNQVDMLLLELSNSWNCLTYMGVDNNKRKIADSINLASPAQLLAKLQSLQYDIPKVRRKKQRNLRGRI